tara:strand:+ start:1127 stop:1333 length:207 start_codon:yes stop_codon:yes gene_type:complete
MIEVIRNGTLWFEFPAANEQNVREMLMRKKVDRECIFRAKGEDDAKIAASIKSKLTTVEPKSVKTSKP